MSVEYLRKARESYHREQAERRSLYLATRQRLIKKDSLSSNQSNPGNASDLAGQFGGNWIIDTVGRLLRDANWDGLYKFLSSEGSEGSRTLKEYVDFVQESDHVGLTKHLFSLDEVSLSKRCLLSCVCWSRVTHTHIQIAELLLTVFGACPNGNAVPVSPPTSASQGKTDETCGGASCGLEVNGNVNDSDRDPFDEFSLFPGIGNFEKPSGPSNKAPTFPLASLGSHTSTVDAETAIYMSTTPLHCVFTMELSHLDNIPMSSLLWDLLIAHGAHVDPIDPSPNATRQTPLIMAIQAANSNGNEASLALLYGTAEREILSVSAFVNEVKQSLTNIADAKGDIRWASFASTKQMIHHGLAGDKSGRQRVIQRYHCLLAAGASVNSFTPPTVDGADWDSGPKFRRPALVSKNPLAQCVYISNQRLTDLRPSYIREMLENAQRRSEIAHTQNPNPNASATINLEQLDHPIDDFDRAAAAKALLDCGADVSSVSKFCGVNLEKVTSSCLRHLLISEGASL